MKNVRILIVEDEGGVALDLKQRLGMLGYQVAGIAASGEQALRLTRERTPDLVLMDIRLQGVMDGIETARTIRERFQPPVVFLTAYAEDDTLERAKLAEPFGYILKPFEDRDLKTAIEMAVYKHRAEDGWRRQIAITQAINRVLLETLQAKTEEEVADVCLGVARELSGSRFGWMALVNQAGRLDTVAVSAPGWELCRVAGGKAAAIRDVAIRGIFGRVLKDAQSLMTNAPAAHPDWIGLPAGHPELTAFLGVPLKDGGRTIGMVALANKPSGYAAHDQHAVETLAVAFVGVLNRRRTALTLRNSEEKYRELVENLNEAVFTADASGVIEYVSQPATRLTGYLPQELTGRRFSEFIHPDDAPEVGERFREALEGRRVEHEFRYRTKDGQTRWGHASVRAAVEDGRTVGIRGIFSDITERKRAAEERARLEDHLRQARKVDAIGRLASGVAHDFNNMLGVILGYGEQLVERFSPGDPVWEDLQQILGAGRRSSQLTRQLLAFSRQQTLQPEVLNLNSLLQNMERMLGRLIQEDVQLELVLAEDLAPVLADAGQIEQVVVNLAVNARDAMPLGGKLTVQTANVDVDQSFADRHAGVVPGQYVMLAVTDTGCGMDEETLSQIFEPFFTTKEKGKGTGLGLATVYGIVAQSGGSMWAESAVGRGTTFRIYLPQTEGEEAKTVPAEAATRTGRGEHILVVEDEASLRALLERMLVELGYGVTSAATGRDALRCVEERGLRPDMVITDVVMPEMNGSELSERLRRHVPDLPVLFMSGYTDSAIAHHGVLDPGVPFLHKPFTLPALAAAIRKLLPSGPSPGRTKKSVLIIDDEATFREMVGHSCRRAGHDFADAASSAAALGVLAERRVDVLLVDRNIPGTDGGRVLEAIRAAGYTMPALVLTGDLDSVDCESLRPLGVVQAIEKSADMRPLLKLLDELGAESG